MIVRLNNYLRVLITENDSSREIKMQKINLILKVLKVPNMIICTQFIKEEIFLHRRWEGQKLLYSSTSSKFNISNYRLLETFERPSVRDMTRAPAGGIRGSGTYRSKRT